MFFFDFFFERQVIVFFLWKERWQDRGKISKNSERFRKNYFFFNVKKERFLGSSPLGPWPAGSVWARPEPEPEAPASATWLIELTHWSISLSSEAWKRLSPPFAHLKKKCYQINLQAKKSARGHPTTTWTRFWPFLTTHPPLVEMHGHYWPTT